MNEKTQQPHALYRIEKTIISEYQRKAHDATHYRKAVEHQKKWTMIDMMSGRERRSV